MLLFFLPLKDCWVSINNNNKLIFIQTILSMFHTDHCPRRMTKTNSTNNWWYLMVVLSVITCCFFPLLVNSGVETGGSHAPVVCRPTIALNVFNYALVIKHPHPRRVATAGLVSVAWNAHLGGISSLHQSGPWAWWWLLCWWRDFKMIWQKKQPFEHFMDLEDI